MSDKVNIDKEDKTLNNDKKTKKKWGGARKNAGRKCRLTTEARQLLHAAIDDRWPMILDVLDHYIIEKDKDILKFVIEHRCGKPGQAIDLSGKIDTGFDMSDEQFNNLLEAIKK